MKEPEGEKYDTLSSDHFRLKSLPSMTKTDSSCSSMSSMTSTSRSTPRRSALRRGKFDTLGRSQAAQPTLDLGIICDLFGENATLYNVLGIDSWADAAEIRRAYLSKGRTTLLNSRGSSFTPENAPQLLDDFPAPDRKKFQAISMAYEVLSTPDFRYDYDRHGVVRVHSLGTPSNVTETSSHSVRWKPYVEEKLIIDSHPDEHFQRTDTIEDSHEQDEMEEWIESPLRNIEVEEVEKPSRGIFLNSFDEVIMSMQKSFGSLIGTESNKNTVVSTVPENNHGYVNEYQMAVEPYQQGNHVTKQRSSAAVFSLCVQDTTDTVGLCGLSDSFYNILGRDDQPTVRSE
eukprot:CAMPEP_0183727542 /NCGR_PEP_ID=MMETSP0737-20130205/25820_1 /TAXON_ID=385413 /ORGANISM="Thalassiosira miniscula, Strain CCMP1093" /LENGTH=343 /DNA_ID=CAMNT_0025959205 /DNA_START=152 /DNA_END=1183 /DNA_ORIENTATION=-